MSFPISFYLDQQISLAYIIFLRKLSYIYLEKNDYLISYLNTIGWHSDLAITCNNGIQTEQLA